MKTNVLFIVSAYQEILKIPSGAMHIQIQEAYDSHNYLGNNSSSLFVCLIFAVGFCHIWFTSKLDIFQL